MTDCLFCKIVNKELAADIVYEEDETTLPFGTLIPRRRCIC